MILCSFVCGDYYDLILLHFQNFIAESEAWCKPDNIHICDGSDAENAMLLEEMQRHGEIKPLPKYKNW